MLVNTTGYKKGGGRDTKISMHETNDNKLDFHDIFHLFFIQYNNPSLVVIIKKLFLGKMVRAEAIWMSYFDLEILDLDSSHICFTGSQLFIITKI